MKLETLGGQSPRKLNVVRSAMSWLPEKPGDDKRCIGTNSQLSVDCLSRTVNSCFWLLYDSERSKRAVLVYSHIH
jgi:hypothetical protein